MVVGLDGALECPSKALEGEATGPAVSAVRVVRS
jgi:hypothetical protein